MDVRSLDFWKRELIKVHMLIKRCETLYKNICFHRSVWWSQADQETRFFFFYKPCFLFLPDVLGLNHTTFLHQKFPTNEIYMKVVEIGPFTLFFLPRPPLSVRTYGTGWVCTLETDDFQLQEKQV